MMCTLLDYAGRYNLLLTGDIQDDSVGIPLVSNYYHHQCRYILLDNCLNLFKIPYKSNKKKMHKSLKILLVFCKFIQQLCTNNCSTKFVSKKKNKKI
jgi:hypothetical protein